jgi:hypothetical protein
VISARPRQPGTGSRWPASTSKPASPERRPPARPADTLGSRIADTAALIAQLQQAIAEEYQAAREDGYDPATARLMIATLHADLTHARDNLARLSAVRSALTTTTTTTDTAGLAQTLHAARARPDELDTTSKQVVLDALGVTVHVTGYTTCATCDGTGYQPIPPGHGRHWPPSCPHLPPHADTPGSHRPHHRTPATAGPHRPARGQARHRLTRDTLHGHPRYAPSRQGLRLAATDRGRCGMCPPRCGRRQKREARAPRSSGRVSGSLPRR